MKFKLFFTIIIIYTIKKVSAIFYTKIINSSLISNDLLNHHHIVLLQKKPFMSQTKYNDIYAVDFCPCGNLFEILFGEKIKGKIRIFYIDKCNSSNIIHTIKTLKKYRIIDIKNSVLNANLSDIKITDNNIYNKIINWDLTFHFYTRNCQDFARYLIN